MQTERNGGSEGEAFPLIVNYGLFDVVEEYTLSGEICKIGKMNVGQGPTRDSSMPQGKTVLRYCYSFLSAGESVLIFRGKYIMIRKAN